MYKESNLERIKILTNEVETLKEEKDVVDVKLARLLKSSKDLKNIIESQRRRVQRETNMSQNHSYKSSTHRSAGHRPNGAHMRPPHRSYGPRPHRDSLRPSFRPAGHRPHGPSMNPWRPTMN
nr:hypothetical protein [Tanacetum cinerariifolium]